MTMRRTNIYIDEEMDRWLRHLAVEQGRSFTDLVREALHEYLAKRGLSMAAAPRVAPPRRSIPREEWQREMEQMLQNIHDSIETDLTPDEIEALITEASEDARQERIAKHLSAGATVPR
jgi:hypothetical protein